MTVKSILARKGTFVPVIAPQAPVKSALVHLEKDEISALIVSSDEAHIEGILTAADIARGLHHFGAEVLDLPVERLMSPNVKTCDVSASVVEVNRLMSEHHIRHVPVTRDGKLHGLINILDVVRRQLDESEADAKSMRDYVAGHA